MFSGPYQFRALLALVIVCNTMFKDICYLYLFLNDGGDSTVRLVYNVGNV